MSIRPDACPRHVSGLHRLDDQATECACGERHPGYPLPAGWSWSERDLHASAQRAGQR